MTEYYYVAVDSSGKHGLWVSDGTALGTKEVALGTQGASYDLSPRDFVQLGADVVFVGVDYTGYAGVWITGASGDVSELQSGVYEATALGPAYLARAGSHVVFSASNGPEDYTSLWSTNGSASGAGIIVYPTGFHAVNASGFFDMGGYSLFTAQDPGGAFNNYGLWATDGTAAGTSEILAGAQGAYSLAPKFYARLGDRAVFAGVDSSGNTGLWVTDGTASGTFEIAAGTQGGANLAPSQPIVAGTRAFFIGSDSGGQQGVWATDGSVSGTREVAAGMQGGDALGPYGLIAAGARAVFSATDSTGYTGLWASDGTIAGTKQILSGNQNGDDMAPETVAQFGGAALFVGVDSTNSLGLWITDGTQAGTSELQVGQQGAYKLSPSQFTVAGSKVYFTGTDANNQDDLWVSDGAAAGTHPVSPNTQTMGAPFDLTAFGDDVVFLANDDSDDAAVWISDGSTITELAVGAGDQSILRPQFLQADGAHVLFEGVDSSERNAEWSTDGTPGGTQEISPFGSDGVGFLNDADSTPTASFTSLQARSASATAAEITLAGTAADYLAISTVEIFDGATALGAASVNPDGAWTLTVNLGIGDYADLVAVAQNIAEKTFEAPALFSLAVAANATTQTNADGSSVQTSFNITGAAFSQRAISRNVKGQIIEKYYSGVSGEGSLSAFALLYSGGSLIGSDDFYVYASGEPYADEEVDYDGGGRPARISFSDLTGGQPYSGYQFNYVGGVFAGSAFTYTTVPAGSSYSSYEIDYDQTDRLSGEKFFFSSLTGVGYSGQEEDFDGAGKLARVVLTGVTYQPFDQLEEDYNAGVYQGFKAYYSVVGQSYQDEVLQVSAANQIEKVIFGGLTSTPYSSFEQDYANGALSTTTFDFTDVTGANYHAYQVREDAAGNALVDVFDLNVGGHVQIALTSGQTLTSQGADKMTGDGATTFLLNPIYGADTITNLTTSDSVSISTSEFSDFDDLLQAAAPSGGAVVIAATDGDTLTLKNMSLTTLAGMSGNFTFHA